MADTLVGRGGGWVSARLCCSGAEALGFQSVLLCRECRSSTALARPGVAASIGAALKAAELLSPPQKKSQGTPGSSRALALLSFQATSTPAWRSPQSVSARLLPRRRGSRAVPTATRPPPQPAAPPRARLCLPHSTSARRCPSSSKACAGGPPRQVRAPSSQPAALRRLLLFAPRVGLGQVLWGRQGAAEAPGERGWLRAHVPSGEVGMVPWRSSPESRGAVAPLGTSRALGAFSRLEWSSC